MPSDDPWGAAEAPDGPHRREGPRPSSTRPTLNTAVRLRRADRAFYLRLAGAIRQNKRALERLRQ